MKSILFLLTILLTGFTEAYSCECYQMNLSNEIDSADLIFQGILIDKKQSDSKMIYKFSVEKVWKGEKSDMIELMTGLGGPDCGMVFELGKAYVVYSKNGRTSNCMRNSLIDKTFDDLKLDYRFLPDYALTSFSNVDRQLNDKESDYLNQQFQDLAENYNFNGKSILFTSNRSVINKRDWFQRFWTYDKPMVQLVKLTDQEKMKTGFDAILLTYCKILITDKTKKKILNQVKD